MRAVDTNVLVRLLTRDDPAQVAAAEAWVVPGAWVSHVALVEALWVLEAVYAATHRRLGNAVEMLLEHQDLALQDPDVVAAALEIFRARKRVGFSDCLLVEIARKAGHTPLGTFDRALARVAGAERVE